ncbi:hypothetical protein [Mucilaginibacter sp. PAMB04168]|uniref:hypothetical protein n=1 Tax=Mucilaginibacter sp. PAMB04168 TaxID=3138567 RepID=UPI0031F6C444
MKNLLLLTIWGIITSNILNMQSDYTITEWPVANDLKAQPGSKIVMNIEYNNGVVYQLIDGKYVVMPINPFAKCLVTKNRDLLDKWIFDSYFPTDEDVNKFYFGNKEKIDNIKEFEKILIEELSKHIGSDLNNLDDSSKIDDVYSVLKKRKTFIKFKLNFTVLVGSYISNKHRADSISWAKLKIKQLLNPITEIVLTKVVDHNNRYFNIQEQVLGKWGYRGIRDIEASYNRKWLKPNELYTLEK